MTYTAIKVSVDEKQSQKMRNAIEEKKPLSIKVIINKRALEKKTVLFTSSQIQKIERAQLIGKNSINIRMSQRQVQANTTHKGGFLWGLLSRLAPAILGGIASGLASKVVSGHSVYIQKNGYCAKVEPVKSGGLYLSPHPHITHGENSPLKNIPFLNILF